MMEPMTLSPTAGVGSSGAMSYLPGFLLGDAHQHSESSGHLPVSQLQQDSFQDGRSQHVSPSRNMTAVTSPYLGGAVSPPGVLSKSSIPPHNRPDYNRGSKTKLDGPPIAGLFDDLNFKNSAMSTSVTSPLNQLNNSMQMNEEAESPGFWVVVFGFPPSHQSHVLSIFSQLGRVQEHSFPTNGNWMFIKYQSRIDVRKALAHNERIVSGNIMIGVAERRSKMSPKEMANESFQMMNTSSKTASSLNNSTAMPKIRNLSVRRDNQVVSPHLVPTRDTSVMSKVVDLLFGW